MTDENRARTRKVIGRLKKRYPDARCSLNYRSPFQLLVATILSAQCTDARVNIVTKALFKKYRKVQDYADADPDVFSEDIRSTGFFRNKTKSIIGTANALLKHHRGQVPRTMEELSKLPGVGRKTANVVLGNAFGIDEGVVVDTHVTRISGRLGLTRNKDAVKIERDLVALVPRKDWTLFPHLMISHGREICQARTPKCEMCPINALCPSAPSGDTNGKRTPGDRRRSTRH
jgi:endonuclease III